MTEYLFTMDYGPLVLSMKLALATTLSLLVLATPVAYLLAFNKFRGKALVEAVFALPIVLPPTVLGFFVLIAIGNLSPVGPWYKEVFGHSLAFSFEGLVLASILYSFPFAVQPMQNAFESINPHFIDAAKTMGCTPWKRFWRVVLPAARAGVVTGSVLAFAHTIGEFGVVLMVGGSIPGETKVASIAIYEHVETLEYAEAAVMSMILLAFSFVVLSVVYYYNRRAVRMTGRLVG